MALPEYRQKRKALARAGVELEKSLIELLEQSRKTILKELGAQPSHWRQAFLQELLGHIEVETKKLTYLMQAKLRGDLAMLGQQVDDLLLTLLPGNAPIVMAGLDAEKLNALLDYSSSLISNVSDEVKNGCSAIVRRAMMTGAPLLQVESELGSAIKKKGRFGSLAKRTQTIARTEFARVLEMANQSALEKAAEYVPGLMKQWFSTGYHKTRPRPAHQAAHGQIVPFDKPFHVGGEDLMYPLDPSGSASNTINCRCTSLPVIKEDLKAAKKITPKVFTKGAANVA